MEDSDSDCSFTDAFESDGESREELLNLFLEIYKHEDWYLYRDEEDDDEGYEDGGEDSDADFGGSRIDAEIEDALLMALKNLSGDILGETEIIETTKNLDYEIIEFDKKADFNIEFNDVCLKIKEDDMEGSNLIWTDQKMIFIDQKYTQSDQKLKIYHYIIKVGICQKIRGKDQKLNQSSRINEKTNYDAIKNFSKIFPKDFKKRKKKILEF